MKHHQRTLAHGFTLVELAIVIVILGLLAAIVVPRFQGQNDFAKASATKAALGSIRTAITSFRAARAMEDGAPRYPTWTELTTPGIVLNESVVPNPYKDTTQNDQVLQGQWTQNDPPVFLSDEGWVYDSTNGKFWANSSTDDINENRF